ncbi:MAG: bifunctional hydroxymethylpyrimidine kinase/phosphomethylpyrimidine kinase [Comamonadaceae bacterium]|nr:bifunctional hydroxymethylpyrimidine kinase/phosphomethylpyrimidine kinase [Comamonadaceae bacterium]
MHPQKTHRPPVLWSIAGADSSGGAGLSADQRAADAFGVHLCPVVAAVTAQHSRAVTRIAPVAPDVLEAQLDALASDMPPAAIKTGLLGSAGHIRAVARWVDRLRAARPMLALVVDPVLRASTGAAFADADVLRAYVEELLPRATLVTPNEGEARQLAALAGSGSAGQGGNATAPALTQALRALGAAAVAVTGGDSAPLAGWALDWLGTPHAQGWLGLPRVPTPHHHGTGCTFASSAAAALALGFVSADALVLAKMATTHALRHGHAAGQGAGPVSARPGFAAHAAQMPWLSFDAEVPQDWPLRWQEKIKKDSNKPFMVVPEGHFSGTPQAQGDMGLYGIAESAAQLQALLAAGLRTVQLRMKAPPAPDAAWHAALREAMTRSMAASAAAGARLFINDHWRVAHALADGQPGMAHVGLHLGQEDLAALTPDERRQLAASGLPLGISSHSLWELARARGLTPAYIACGPVWPTTTKDMPWRPQGLDNLAWWVRMAGCPVAAIGGILSAEQVADAAQTGASAICAVRALAHDPARHAPPLNAALQKGRAGPPRVAPALPQPSLQGGHL